MPMLSAKNRSFFSKNFDLFLIILFSIVPLFMTFPYRVNIFLSWEGAYRLYLGQVPYKDFGIPLGYAYWLVPALFFKIFGPYFISLIKAQVVLNIAGGLAFRSTLKKFNIVPAIRIAAVLTFCLSYILMNFWPWYNNTDIIYEIIGLNFLIGFLLEKKWKYLQLFVSCFFLFVSFFTKQDGGALGFLIASALVLYHAIEGKKWKDLVLFFLFYFAVACLFILPSTQYSIGYWFNHGQPPHSSRISVKDLMDAFFGDSQWIKFYILLIILLLIWKIKNFKTFFNDRMQMLFLILTVGILIEAAIFQVTSYTPPDNNIFYHSYAIAFILTGFATVSAINFSAIKNSVLLFTGIFLWWSGVYWKYLDRISSHLFPSSQNETVSTTGENVINMHTYMINLDTTHYEDESTWKEVPGMKSFQKMYLPPSTVAGIGRLEQMPQFKNKEVRVLNMTELTPLDYELGYKLETGEDYPLWYHLGVCCFNKQRDEFCEKIKNNYYDVVMFEYVPSLNNFYPFKVRDCLISNYEKVDSFLAPRRPTNGVIEVYVKK